MTGATMAAAIACTLAVAIAAGARGQPTGDDDRTPTTTTTGPTAAAEDLRRRPFDGTADGPNHVSILPPCRTTKAFSKPRLTD